MRLCRECSIKRHDLEHIRRIKDHNRNLEKIKLIKNKIELTHKVHGTSASFGLVLGKVEAQGEKG